MEATISNSLPTGIINTAQCYMNISTRGQVNIMSLYRIGRRRTPGKDASDSPAPKRKSVRPAIVAGPAESIAAMQQPGRERDRFRNVLVDIVMQQTCRPPVASAAPTSTSPAGVVGRKASSGQQSASSMDVDHPTDSTATGWSSSTSSRTQPTLTPAASRSTDPLTSAEKDELRQASPLSVHCWRLCI